MKKILNSWKEEIVPKNPFLRNTCRAFRKGKLFLLFDAREPSGKGFRKHASLSCQDRYPTWEEILDVRYTFFDDSETVYQILPPKSEYVNLHKNCFHLWGNPL